MDEETRDKILKWIYNHHDHHAGTPGRVATLDLENGSMSEFQEEGGNFGCTDGDKPYVNSLELEEFIKKLGKHE